MSAKDKDIGGYRLIREIGRGGFGSVHLAETPGGGLAAVKLLHVDPGTDPRFARMFADEVDAARRVSPFCVAQVLDADPHAEQPWIASEYIEGRTLAEEIGADGPRTGAGLQRLAISTATALTAIHRAGIVHRDFKPENIMMATDGPRVIDFGIARVVDETTAFDPTSRVGTLLYMAPEQLEDGVRLTSALDLFAWGAVMVYAATGRHAFAAERQSAVIRRILTDTPDCSALPGELPALVTRCLEKEPERRPSAHQVLNFLLGHTGNDTDIDTALHQGNTAATEKMPSLPPTRRETQNESPNESNRPPTRVWEPRSKEVDHSGPLLPPYRFAGRLYHEVGTLAAAMQAAPEAAATVFSDAGERTALATWITNDLGDTRIDRNLLRKPPKDPVLAVASFVSQTRPDLPARYGEVDMSLSALPERAQKPQYPSGIFLVPFPGNAVEVMEVMAAHECRDPAHDCVPGDGCAEYRRFIEDVRSAMRAYEAESRSYAPWVREYDPDPDQQDRFESHPSSFVSTFLDMEHLERRARKGCANVKERWRQALPPMPTPGTPISKRVSRLLVLDTLWPVTRVLATRDQQFTTSKERVEEFAVARRKANNVATKSGWPLGLVLAPFVFGLVGWMQLDSSQEPRIGLAVLAVIVVFILSDSVVNSEPRARVKAILKDVKDPYTTVNDPKEKLRRANKTIGSLTEEVRKLDRAREELMAISRNT